MLHIKVFKNIINFYKSFGVDILDPLILIIIIWTLYYLKKTYLHIWGDFNRNSPFLHIFYFEIIEFNHLFWFSDWSGLIKFHDFDWLKVTCDYRVISWCVGPTQPCVIFLVHYLWFLLCKSTFIYNWKMSIMSKFILI